MTPHNEAIARLPYVEGALNYLKPTADKPRTYAFELPPGGPLANAAYEPHTVPIRDVRPVAERVSLDREGFAINSGSSCTASTLEPSHVLVAMGVLTHGNARVSLPRGIDAAEVDRFLEVLPRMVADLRTEAGVADL